jgi:hypothetical protein
MENQPKNYIPDDVLAEADGDPRAAFGIMATKEVLSSNQTPSGKTFVMEQNKSVRVQKPTDNWSRMDDI